jgi:dienelactone hydrolase
VDASDVDEALGFAINAETRAALAAINLVRATQRPAPAVLVIDRDDLPATDTWRSMLASLGAEVRHARLPGYVEMVLDPHLTKIPTAIIAGAIEFALARPPLAGSHEAPAPIIAYAAAAFAGNGTVVTEEIVRLDGALFGIASRPHGAARRVLILLNAGAVHHIGPNRMYVTLARRLAAKGTLVLRLDLSGIGDSPARGGIENVVYSDYALDDVSVAVAWARRAGATHVTVAGMCSGAYHALKAAVHREPIDAVVPINPLTFFWKPDTPLDFPSYRVAAAAQRYGKSVRSAAAWKKVLRGDVDLRYAAEVVVLRAREAAAHRGRDVLRRLRVPLEDDLGAELLALGRNGVAMRFVFAASDPGHAMLHEHGGAAVARLAAAGKLAIDILEGPDHTFTARWTQLLVLDAIERAAES